MVKKDIFPSDTSVHHIGLGVRSIEAVLKGLGIEAKITEDPIQKVKVAFVDINGIVIELIEPLDESSPVYQNVVKGNKLLHICYETPSLEEAATASKAYGFYSITKPVPAPAFDNRNIQWLFNKDFGLVELVEKETKE